HDPLQRHPVTGDLPRQLPQDAAVGRRAGDARQVTGQVDPGRRAGQVIVEVDADELALSLPGGCSLHGSSPASLPISRTARAAVWQPAPCPPARGLAAAARAPTYCASRPGTARRHGSRGVARLPFSAHGRGNVGSLDNLPVEWAHPLAVVRLPAEVDVLNAEQVRDTLLAVLNQGITTLVIDMTGTAYCGVAGVGALARAQQRAVASGAEIRVAAAAPIV